MVEDQKADVETGEGNESWNRLSESVGNIEAVVGSTANGYSMFMEGYGWGDMDDIKQTARLALFLAWDSKEKDSISWKQYRDNVQQYHGYNDVRMHDIEEDVFVGFAKKTMDRGIRAYIRDNMGHSDDTEKRSGWYNTMNFSDVESMIGGEEDEDYLMTWLSMRSQDTGDADFEESGQATVDRLGKMFNIDTSGLSGADADAMRDMLFESALEALGGRGLSTGQLSGGSFRERGLKEETALREAAAFRAIFIEQRSLAAVQKELVAEDPDIYGNYDTLKRAAQRIPGILESKKQEIAELFTSRVDAYKG